MIEYRILLSANASQLSTVKEVAKCVPLVVKEIDVVVTIEIEHVMIAVAIAIAIEDVGDVVIAHPDIRLSRTRRQAPACRGHQRRHRG
jgi:hypothetical protein